MSNKVNQA